MGVVIFNGVSSKEYGIQVEHPPGYEFPEKDYETVHVPGRNGDVYIDKGSYKNVSRSYEIAVGSMEKDFPTMANYITEMMYSGSGYSRLEDTYEPEYYRMAVYKKKASIENILEHAGRVTIEFDCKPQRFLKTGDQTITFSQNGILRNPTNFSSTPIIKVNCVGDGKLRIGKYYVKLSSIPYNVTINSEVQDVYRGATNCNNLIKLENGFPKLDPGENEISFSGGITSVEVIPKWWTL